MWRNNIVVRALAQATLKKDLPIFGLDQKGVHMNEAGSKCIATLEIAGAPAVPIKLNHAATRSRVSFMTTVTSDAEAARQPRRLPLEILVKGTSDQRRGRILRSFQLPPDLNMSKQVGPKGSYRTDHIITFLARWLLPWSAERAAAQDWRLLYMDAYRAHMDDTIAELCYERGYILLFHYGCTTGIAQVNDTDLHQAFSKLYIEMETESFLDKQALDPTDIGRTYQEVVDDAAAVWRAVDHNQGVQGHKRTGLSISLDGTEDHMARREAAMFWFEPGHAMGPYRDTLVRDVQERVASGSLAWADVRSLIEHPAGDVGSGAFGEGAEFDGEWEEGELKWEERGEKDKDDEERTEEFRAMLEDLEPSGFAIVPAPGDTADELDDAAAALRDFDLLEAMDRYAAQLKMPAVRWHAQARRATTLKRIHGGKTAAGAPSAVLARAAQEQVAAERRRLGEARRKATVERQRAKTAKWRAKAAKENNAAEKARAKARAQAATQEIADQIAAARLLPSRVSAARLGQGAPLPNSPAYVKAREEVWELLRLRCQPFGARAAAEWDRVRAEVAKRWTGAGCVNKLRDLQGREAKTPGYFERFVLAESEKLPQPASYIDFGRAPPAASGVAASKAAAAPPEPPPKKAKRS